MSDTFEKRLQQVFSEAVALPVTERASFLQRACADDADLRARVEALLTAHARAGDFLTAPAVPSDLTAPPPVGHPGERVGRYKLLEMIGEGGFATVYRAEQQEPIRREVALKIIKLGMDTKQVIARFEAERQALAILDHPNIAKVFDAGATDTGRPYFVMELVRGMPVTEYADRHNLQARQRLELFIPICQAVQHAHQKGIIHRDLKPNNILVTMKEDRAVAKIIDFGIAKAVQSRLTERTLFTEFRQFIGTPTYMSPEQASFDAADVDTRSDIYSLGVLLYELLTGTTPIEEKTLRAAAYDQMQKMIREFEPPPPSTRITTMGNAALSIAAVRRVEPKALRRSVRGEVDWIVMKCLEKDRARRYESAGALAADIGRHLTGDIVAASSPSAAYRLRKFARRNRVAIGVGALILGCLVIALPVSLVALAKEKRARRLADEANESSTAVANYAMFRSFGDPRAEPLFRQAFDRVRLAYGPDDPLTINAQRNLGRLLASRDKIDEGITTLRESLERSRRVMGATAEGTILNLQDLITCLNQQQRYEEALEFDRELDAAVKDPRVQPRFRLWFGHWLGGKLTLLHRYSEARQTLLEALSYLMSNGGERETIRGVMQLLAEGCDALGKPDEAAKWRREIETYQATGTTRPAP